MIKDKLIGTWTLISYIMTPEGSQDAVLPYGENPIGYLIYTPTNVSVHIMRANRAPRDTPLDEKLEAAENYGGYVGHYEIKGSTITHYIDASGFLNFLTTPQVREFQFIDDSLILECTSFDKTTQKKMFSHLVWKRSNE